MSTRKLDPITHETYDEEEETHKKTKKVSYKITPFPFFMESRR